MAVLVEAMSVEVRRDAIDARYPGSWQGFLRAVLNRTLCTYGVNLPFFIPFKSRGLFQVNVCRYS
jgi:hypothetical protein